MIKNVSKVIHSMKKELLKQFQQHQVEQVKYPLISAKILILPNADNWLLDDDAHGYGRGRNLVNFGW
jgi:hypothetical protein